MAKWQISAFMRLFFEKCPFWGITVVYRRLLVFNDIPAFIADVFCTWCDVFLVRLCMFEGIKVGMWCR